MNFWVQASALGKNKNKKVPETIWLYDLYLFSAVPGIESRPSHMQNKCSTTQPQAQVSYVIIKIIDS